MSAAVDARFWAKVKKTDTCWNWTGGKSHGYGLIKRSGSIIGAHRYSYQIENGPIEPGLFIDHMCHDRACVNPAHLRLATPKQNAENYIGSHRDSRTGARGVYWNARAKQYQGMVTSHGKRHHVGMFRSLPEAVAAVTAKRNELFTHNLADRIPA